MTNTEDPTSSASPAGSGNASDGPPTSRQARKVPPPPGWAGPAPSSLGPGSSSNQLEQRIPTFPEEQLSVTAWPDPVLDQLGHDPRSMYVEKFWLSILGPSCLLLLRRLAIELERNPEGFVLEPLPWAQELGLGMKGGKHGPFWRSIERACRFGTAQRVGQSLTVRRRLPPLTARQAERLPAHLKAAHEAWLAERLNMGKRQTIAKWSGPVRYSPPPAQAPGDSPNQSAA